MTYTVIRANAWSRQSRAKSTVFILIRFLTWRALAKANSVPGGFLNRYDSQDRGHYAADGRHADNQD